MLKQKSDSKKLQKALSASLKAAQIAVTNKEIVETLVSMEQIKSGKYKVYKSADELLAHIG